MNVPVDGFWSISLYTAKGFFEKNPYDAYSHLGAGCDGIQIHLVVGIVVVVRDRSAFLLRFLDTLRLRWNSPSEMPFGENRAASQRQVVSGLAERDPMRPLRDAPLVGLTVEAREQPRIGRQRHLPGFAGP